MDGNFSYDFYLLPLEDMYSKMAVYNLDIVPFLNELNENQDLQLIVESAEDERRKAQIVIEKLSSAIAAQNYITSMDSENYRIVVDALKAYVNFHKSTNNPVILDEIKKIRELLKKHRDLQREELNRQQSNTDYNQERHTSNSKKFLFIIIILCTVLIVITFCYFKKPQRQGIGNEYVSKINQLYGGEIVSFDNITKSINTEEDCSIALNIIGNRYGQCDIYGILKDNIFKIDNIYVQVVYSKDVDETVNIFKSIIEATLNINSDTFERELHKGCIYWEDNTEWDIHITDNRYGKIYGEAGYIVLNLENKENANENSGDPGYFVGTMTVVNCDKAPILEKPDIESVVKTYVPKWTEVDAYYIDHEWYYCFYNDSIGVLKPY